MNNDHKKRLKLMILPMMFALVFLVYGTYAWFTYYSDVDTNMTGHVVGWNIEFKNGSSMSEEFTVTIDKIYPGMNTFSSVLEITNKGDAKAEITYAIKSISILGTDYIVGNTVDGVLLTPANIEDFIASKYPFKFNFDIDKEYIIKNEKTNFTVSLDWPYQTFKKVEDGDSYNDLMDYFIFDGSEYHSIDTVNIDNFDSMKTNLYYSDDETDTYWGNEAFEFIETETAKCVKLVLVVDATQYVDPATPSGP